MLDVASLSQFDFFAGFHLAAGKKGTYRIISNVVILDHEVFDNNYSDFHEGDFVITNLLYAKEHPELLESSFRSLMEVGVSAIAIKSVFFNELNQEVIAMADEYNIPIYFFNNIYIEDVILNIVDFLRSTGNYSYYEELTDAMVQPKDNKDSIQKFLEEAGIPQTWYASASYLTFRQQIDLVSLQRNLNQLLHRKNSLANGGSILCVTYKKGFLLISFSPTLPTAKKAAEQWPSLFRDLGLQSKDYYTGILDEPLAAAQMDLVLIRTFQANEMAVTDPSGEFCYSKIGLNALFLSAKADRATSAWLKDCLHLLYESEGAGASALMATLKACVAHHFKMEPTAKALFQHPNTVRYRLGKIKAILGCEDDFTFQLLATLMVGVWDDAASEQDPELLMD